MRGSIRFCWVVALRAEAKPLTRMFSMKILSNNLLFPIYFNHENGHVLVISGIGQVRSAAAAMFLREKLDIENYAAWINIGIAGYSKEPIGAFYQALKVVDQENNKSYFPGTRLSKLVSGRSLITVNKPEEKFCKPDLYDMEATGFCEIAPFFSCNELTYVFKIVSDTLETPKTQITTSYIDSLIEQNKEPIVTIVGAIEKLVREEENRLKLPNNIQELLDNYHFTEANRIRFLKVYRKWHTIFPNRSVVNRKQPPLSANDLISKLENELNSKTETWTLT